MTENVHSNLKTNAHKYDHLFLQHPLKNEWFGNYVNFEGGQQFNTSMSALYLVVRDNKSDSDTPHTHDFDEYLSFIGLDADNPQHLGAEIDLCLGEEQEKHSFNKTTTIYIPRGMKHLPLKFKNIEKQFLLVHLFLTRAYTRNE